MNFDDQRNLQQRQNPMNTHIMLDLETLGHKPGAALIALGAVKFDAGGITAEFYRRIDAESCVQCGLVVDVSTVLWWFKQDDAARAEFARPGDPLPAVLCDFREWAGWPDADKVKLWGNGAGFDNALLAAAYEACRLSPPWKYYNDRCYRTLKALHPGVPLEPAGVKHHALDDAKTQALHLLRLLDQNAGLLLA